MGLGGALEMKVVKPDKYDSATAQKIADHLLNERTVVLNLEATNKESARRLIDFLSGVAYSISGYIQRVANNTFVIVPKNVDVSGEQLQEVRKQEDNDLY
jgi:cell division inhibitor SepF